MEAKKIKFILLAGCVAILAITLRIYFFVESIKYVPVSPDEALTVLGAKEVARGNFPLLVMAQPYQFPLESYLYAPLLNILPRNTFGARLLIVIESLCLTIIVLLLFLRLGKLKDIFPGILLFLFPSAYLLTIQFAYSLPHNMPIYVLGFLALLIVESVGRETRTSLLITRLVMAGLLLGISFPINMVSLPLIMPIVIVGILRGGIKRFFISTFSMLAGVFVGLTPYWLAIFFEEPGAHKALAGTRDIASAVGYFKLFAIYTLPRATGFGTTLFPDCSYFMNGFEGILPIVGTVIFLLLITASIVRIKNYMVQFRQTGELQFNAFDAMLGTFILCALLFALSKRSTSLALRYTLPAVMAIPFLVAAVYVGLRSYLLKRLIAIFSVLLALYNFLISFKLVEEWKKDDFAVKIADVPPLDKAISFLLAKGITNCVATHYDAYRINFFTDEKILCSQPMNERFPRWKLPYKKEVYSSSNVAFVLTDVRPATFGCVKFENDMDMMGITAKKEPCGLFYVYYDFQMDPIEKQYIKLPQKQARVFSSHNSELANNAADGDINTRWSSRSDQATNMWLHFIFDKKILLGKIKLHYGSFHNDRSVELIIETRKDGVFYQLPIKQCNDIDPFEIVNGIPCYGNPTRSIKLDEPLAVDNIRISIKKTRKYRSWTILDTEFYCVPL